MTRLARWATTLAALLAFAALAVAQDVRIVPPRLEVAAPAEKPIQLTRVWIGVEASGALAITSVEMVFHNPNSRVLEAELQFPLLEGQNIVGFALDVGGVMREAVPVERSRGQMVFEDITRAQVDPGLLQVTQGNNFKVRVYPIPARGERRVLVRYSEALGVRGGARVYRLPLEYAKGARELWLALRIAGNPRPVVTPGAVDALSFRREGDGWGASVKRPGGLEGVVEVAIPDGAGARAVAQRFGDAMYFHAEGRVRASSGTRALPRVVQLAWDSSGTMAARDFGRERALLDAYFAAARNVEVHLVKVRDAAEPAERFQVANGDWSALRRSLEDTAYDGATHLAAVPHDREAQEVLLFTDGLANFGEGGFAPRDVPVYAISSTARAAPASLRPIAESSGGRFIDLAADSIAGAREKLLRSATRIVALEGEGVRELVAATPILADGRFAVAGILTASRGEVRVTILHPDGRRERLAVAIAAADREGRLAATTWAGWKIAALEGDVEANRAQIRRLGRTFGLATRETSLVVLDRVEDYVRYDIEPPQELAERYASLVAQRGKQREVDRRAHVERIVKRFVEKQAWWEREFPKDDRQTAKEEANVRARGGVAQGALAAPVEERMMAPRPAMSVSAPASPAPARVAADAVSELKSSASNAGGTAIRLRPWAPDAPYAKRMREAAADRVYRVYLDERPDYVQSSAFFLDAADILIERGQPALAVRVLSNLAEMDLENRHLLRILGYRLLQAQHPGLAIPVFRKVLALAPEEPQSYRDLGLAYEADKQHQKAVDLLCEVVMKPWHGRFPDIELIALAELNAIVATAGTAVDASGIDPRLLRNLPLDLRVVLTWDADNTDIDLWVTDPNGEKAYYGHQLTYQGGRMSLDFTGGYGPEEFSLKSAKPGVYKVEANFFGHRQQIVAGATTLQVKLVTGFGTPRAEERIVTLRLKGASEVVHVGDFEVRPPR